MWPWKIYDDLIEAIPGNLRVEECVVGVHWTLVRSRTTGLAMTPTGDKPHLQASGSIQGMPVRELAQYIKSWDFYEAALGLAAINSVLNTQEQVERLCGRPVNSLPAVSAFTFFREQVREKKVAVVGHFPDLQQLAAVCQLTILERQPQEGDLPDPACEYILPGQDYVFITATTLINKTLPRLLELSRGSRVILVGPSTPLTPVLFRHGIHFLAGTVVENPEKVQRIIQEGGWEVFRNGGRMVHVAQQEKDT